MRTLLILPFLALLTACAGFSPMYAEKSAPRMALAQVQISRVQGRAGFELMQQLDNKAGIREGNSGKYQLVVSLGRAQQGFAIQVDRVATKYSMTVTAKWQLLDANGKTVEKMTAVGSSTFDDSGDPYAVQVASQAAEDRAISMAADAILDQLAAYFATNPDPQTPTNP